MIAQTNPTFYGCKRFRPNFKIATMFIRMQLSIKTVIMQYKSTELCESVPDVGMNTGMISYSLLKKKDVTLLRPSANERFHQMTC